MQKVRAQSTVNTQAKQEFSGTTPNLFVGRFGYPHVQVGLLTAEQLSGQDSPKEWVRQKKSIQDIINYRTQLINSNVKTSVHKLQNKIVEMSQEVALAKKPAEIEVALSKKPSFKISLHQHAAPHGPNVELRKARFTQNVKIDQRVEKVVDDDLLATEQIKKLSRRVDEYELTKMFSAGLLGKDQKIVPTRWSITAVDDTLGKQYIKEVRDFPFGDYELYMGSHLGNYYFILCFPEPFRYELFETLVGDVMSFAHDYESAKGRTTYAQETAGGYYATRLAVLERQKKNKRQQGVLALRFITDEYWAPLGVWVVREASRNAMQGKPLRFDDKETMLRFVEELVKKRWKMNVKKLYAQSKVLKEKTLFDF
jgi:hypothetical protein